MSARDNRHTAASRFEDIAPWLIEQGLKGLPLAEQFSNFCRRVAAAGFPMKRASMGVGTLHPRYGAHTFIWRHGRDGIEHLPRERSFRQLEMFRHSPIQHMRETGEMVLLRKLNTNSPLEFPVLEELRGEGMTEFAARVVPYDPAASGGQPDRPHAFEGVYFSCATDAPAGFDADQLRRVGAILPLLAMGIKARLTYDVANTVLETYLGADASQQVLTGRIDRGAVDSIRAVVWLCDLRGYTRLTDALARDELVETLDDHLDVMARPVMAHGGQILKFLGDGFLAVFDLSKATDDSVCANALSAANDLRHDFAAFKAKRLAAGKPVMDFKLALHLGEVFYGNIGASDRLDFTVIGPAVNEASRIEALCRPLDRDILVSRTFQQGADKCRALLSSLGKHALRDVEQPQELFTLIPI